jgi:hypothetical protein
MCGRESLLIPYYLLGSFHYLILFLILSLCVCDFKNINVCDVEESCTCIKEKYEQWIMVDGQLVVSFLMCFYLIY